MIRHTMGVGGDFVNLSDAWDYLVGLMSITESHEFEQISSFNMNNFSVNPISPALIDGLYIKFYCPFEKSHKGNPTRGYKINLSGALGHMNMNVYWLPSYTCNFHIYTENLYFEKIDNTNLTVINITIIPPV